MNALAHCARIAGVAALIVASASLHAFGDTSSAPVAPPAGGASPVTINSCGPVINKSTSQTQTIAGIPVPIPASTSQGIAIEFVNESQKTATLVNFAVDSAGEQFVIRDVGSFAPGVSIKHQYRNGYGQAFVLPAFIAPNISCHVASVKFADGSMWRKGHVQAAVSTPAPPPAAPSSSGALSANPARLSIDSVTNSELFMVTSPARVMAFKEADDCAKVATIFVVATGDASVTYSVKPLAAGSCTAHVTDENSNSVSVPIVVQ